MPLGLRAAAAAMNVLGVERAQDKELHVICETGRGHAAGCFLDGIMAATGCTYGKSNIEKLYHNKMAFTLVDMAKQKAVRVSLKGDFFAQMLQSPFVEQRKAGVAPQDIPPETVDPLVEKVMAMPEEAFLQIGPVTGYTLERKAAVFEAKPCASCGEMTFVDKLVQTPSGLLCQACRGSD